MYVYSFNIFYSTRLCSNLLQSNLQAASGAQAAPAPATAGRDDSGKVAELEGQLAAALEKERATVEQVMD